MPEDLYELIPDQESALGTGIRNVARLGARAVESAAGFPGNVESLGRGVINFIPEAVTGKEVVSPQTVLPTSKNIRSGINKAVGSDYLEPKGDWESLGDEITGDIVSFLMPVPGVTWGAGIKRAIKLAGLSNLAGFVTKNITGSEGAGDVVKMGSLLVPAFFGLPKAKDIMRTAYDKAYKALPQDATVSAKGIKSKLDKISDLIGLGISTPETEDLTKLIADVESKIKGDVIPLRSADRIKKQINKMVYSGNYGGEAELEDLEKLLKTVTHSLSEQINDYAKANPAFGGPYKQGNELFAAINGGPKMLRWIEKHVTPDKAIYSLISSVIKGFAPIGIPATAAILTVPPALRSANILFKSSAIQNNLLSALKAAASENATAFTRAANKMQREVAREYPEWYTAKPDDLYEIINQ